MTTRAQRFWNELFAEHIRLPGVPQFIVTRADALTFLKAVGMDPHGKGFGSIDYLVMRPSALDEPLSDVDVLEVAAKIREIETRSAARYAEAV